MPNNINTSNDIYACTGCSMCAATCPVEAISIVESKDGFYVANVDESKCTGCGLCRGVCYKLDTTLEKQDKYMECYSAVNINEQELKAASSGGVSIELMRACIDNGYNVVGVAYDAEKERAITRIATCYSELEQFKGSKYFQSYTYDAFSKIAKSKTDEKYAVFGTPCQIYALSKYAKKKRMDDKFIFVDIFCHGCPSLKLWDKYLDYSKRKWDSDSFERIDFRSKAHGWHEFCFTFYKQDKRFLSSKYNDPFYELFFGMDAMNEACYNCVSRSSTEFSDIRIGDFWGKRFDQNTKGVSAVVIATEKGKLLFESVLDKFDVQNVDFQEVIKAQSYGKEHTMNSQRRERLLMLLDNEKSMSVIVKKYRKMLPFKTNLKRVVKGALKHLPQGAYLKLKSKLH